MKGNQVDLIILDDPEEDATERERVRAWFTLTMPSPLVSDMARRRATAAYWRHITTKASSSAEDMF